MSSNEEEGGIINMETMCFVSLENVYFWPFIWLGLAWSCVTMCACHVGSGIFHGDFITLVYLKSST